jgi:hypothetical protein
LGQKQPLKDYHASGCFRPEADLEQRACHYYHDR